MLLRFYVAAGAPLCRVTSWRCGTEANGSGIPVEFALRAAGLLAAIICRAWRHLSCRTEVSIRRHFERYRVRCLSGSNDFAFGTAHARAAIAPLAMASDSAIAGWTAVAATCGQPFFI